MGVLKRWRLGILVVIIVLLAELSGAYGANSNLLVFEDDFLNLNYTDTALTTAAVITTPPGIVTISQGQASFAYRPGVRQLAVALTDRIALLAYDGTQLREIKNYYVSGINSVAFSEKGDFLFAGGNNEIKIFGFTAEGDLKQVGSVGYSGVLAVEGTTGNGFWALSKKKASYFGFSGTSVWRELFSISVNNGRSVSYSPVRNAVLILDTNRVRYFAFNGTSWAENSFFEVTVPNAQSVAWTVNGGGYRVLSQGQNVIYFAITPYGLRRYTPLDDVYGGAFGIVRSPWANYDFGVSKPGMGIYRAWSGSSYVTRPELSFAIGGQGVQSSALYVSRVIVTATPVYLIRIAPTEVVPSTATTTYQVSTDGGATWTTVTPLTVTPVPSGNQLVYRIFLTTSDITQPPVIDKVQLLQIAYVVQPAIKVLGGQFKVRLIK